LPIYINRVKFFRKLDCEDFGKLAEQYFPPDTNISNISKFFRILKGAGILGTSKKIYRKIINKMNMLLLLKKNKIIYKIFLVIKKVFIFLRDKINRFVIWSGYLMRKSGLFTSDKWKWSKIKEFENRHINDRCFIVCTGPSLRVTDLDKLKNKNEICFSMNSIVKLFTQTKWRPLYYGINDGYVCKNIEPDIKKAVENADLPFIFLGKRLKKISTVFNNLTDLKNGVNITVFYSIPYILTASDKSPVNNKYKFSHNAYLGLYEGASITYRLLQIAVYMGFKEIYLLGCDCDYTGKNLHAAEYNTEDTQELIRQRGAINETRMINAYKAAKKYTDKHGIKIYNATRGGKLEVFERVDFDKIIK